MQIVTGVILLLWAVEDIYHRSIWNTRLAGGAVVLLMMLLRKMIDGLDIWSVLWGMIPGMGLLLMSVTGKRAVGQADGIVVLLLGMLGGIWKVMSLLLYGLLLFCAVAGVLLLRGKINREARLPFLPFVLAGYLMASGLA